MSSKTRHVPDVESRYRPFEVPTPSWSEDTRVQQIIEMAWVGMACFSSSNSLSLGGVTVESPRGCGINNRDLHKIHSRALDHLLKTIQLSPHPTRSVDCVTGNISLISHRIDLAFLP